MLRDTSSTFGLHLLAHPSEPRSPVQSFTDDDGRVELVLRGQIDFVAAEHIVHLLRVDRQMSRLRIELSGVTSVHPAAAALLRAEGDRRRAQGLVVELVDPHGNLPGVDIT